MNKFNLLFWVSLGIILLSCNETNKKQNQMVESSGMKSTDSANGTASVYRSKGLIVNKIADHVYQHVSFLKTNDFGTVSCNGMIVVNNKEAVIFDSPANDMISKELINFLEVKMHCRIKAIVATHFHADCVGGLKAFHQHGIRSYGSFKTIELVSQRKFVIPQNGFKDSMSLDVGDEKVYVSYFGQGHTKDNVVGYFPTDKVLFGGCLIKELGAAKGNLEDANTSDWSGTVKKIKAKYNDVKLVVPGHGKIGGPELLDYTIDLFENKDNSRK